MRVLLLPFPTKAHIFSMVPIGWALRAAGHEVRFVGQPNPSETAAFLATGLETTWVGDERDLAKMRRQRPNDPTNPVVSPYQISETREERYTPEYVNAVYDLWAGNFPFLAPRSMVTELVAYARQWQVDLVVWDPLMYAGPIAARAAGAVDVRMLFAMDQWAALTDRYLKLGRSRPDPLVDWLGEELARFDCAFDEESRFGRATLDTNPSCLRYPISNAIPVRYVPFNGRSVVPRWVLEPPTRPRVCLTLGVSNREVHGAEQASVAELLDGVAGLDAEIIATFTPEQLASVPRVPDNVRVVDFVPLNDLLPSCSAIVHQGGGGTIGNSVVHGVPQLIIPGTTWAEELSARGFTERGAGLFIDINQLSASTLRAQLTRLLDEPSFQQAAREVQQEMLSTPSPSDVVTTLETLAG